MKIRLKLRKRCKELVEGSDGPQFGNDRWDWVARKLNEEFDGLINKPMNLNSARKLYTYHYGGGKEKKKERSKKLILNPQDEVKVRGGNAIIIPDTHIPFEEEGFLDFCINVADEFDVKVYFHAGDVVDCHSTSFWDSDPNGLSAGDELNEARKRLQKWSKAFPKLHVCLGNHDLRPARQLFKAGIPRQFMKGYNDIYGTPEGWEWNYSYDYYGVLITHGNKGGKYAAQNLSVSKGRSVVSAHTHIYAGFTYVAPGQFAMNVGCGIDDKAYSFAYAKNYIGEVTKGVGVITRNGTRPHFIPFEG